MLAKFYKSLFALILFPFFVYPNSKSDSLRKIIQTSKNDTLVCNAMVQMAKIMKSKDMDSSLYFLSRAIVLADKCNFLDGKIRALTNIANIYYSKADYFEAKKKARESIDLQNSKNRKTEIVLCYMTMANVYYRINEMDSCIQYYLKAIKKTEELKDSVTMANVLHNVAVVYKRQKNYVKAVEYMNKFIEFSRRRGDSVSIGEVQNMLGDLYSEQKQFDKADFYFKESIRIGIKFKDTVLLSFVYPNYSVFFDYQGKFQKSLDYAILALKMSIAAKDEEGVVIGYNNLGDTYMKLKKYDSAEKYLNKSIVMAKAMDRDLTVMYANKGLSRLYFEKGDFKKAYECQSIYISVKDTIDENETKESLRDLTMKFDLDNKEKEILLLNKDQELKNTELKEKRNVIYGVVGFAVLLVMLAFIAIRSSLQRKKDNVKLKELNTEVTEQKHIVEEKNKEIVDSINYAKRIQQSLLANEKMIAKYLPDHFVLFRPKDIVSGDFYWAAVQNNKFYLAVCDSTGHGVPGAFMSLLNIGFLSEAIKEKGITSPDKIFDYTRERLIETISQDGQKDGFDGILVCFDLTTKAITYAAANNAPLILTNGNLIKLAMDKMPVGIGEKKQPFSLFTIDQQPNTIVYFYTDGYADQFGGPKGKKFMYKKLNELLFMNTAKPLAEQSELLKETFAKVGKVI